LISSKTIGRLSLYRRLLTGLKAENLRNIFSHHLAGLAGGTAAQVRRDLMATGYSGTPHRGYNVCDLLDSISSFLDAPREQRVAIVGIGNMGTALIAFFSGRRPNLRLIAAFDRDPSRINRVIHGCDCYSITELAKVVKEEKINIGIITVPSSEAQKVANMLVNAGLHGLVNFAPVALRVPDNVYVDDIDMTQSLEKVAYFARLKAFEENSSK